MKDFIDECTDIETLRHLARARREQAHRYLADLTALRANAPPEKIRLLANIEQMSSQVRAIPALVDRFCKLADKKPSAREMEALLMWLDHEVHRHTDYLATQLQELRNAAAGLPAGTPAPIPPEVP